MHTVHLYFIRVEAVTLPLPASASHLETLRWVGATSNWAGKQKVTWSRFQPPSSFGQVAVEVLFLNLQPSSMGPFGPRQNKITVFDVASWICRSMMTWWKYSLKTPKKEALCGILVADLMYPMTRTGRFHSENLVERISDLASEECKGHVIQMLPASRLRLNRFTVGDDVEYWSATSKCLGQAIYQSWWLGVDEFSLGKTWSLL